MRCCSRRIRFGFLIRWYTNFSNSFLQYRRDQKCISEKKHLNTSIQIMYRLVVFMNSIDLSKLNKKIYRKQLVDQSLKGMMAKNTPGRRKLERRSEKGRLTCTNMGSYPFGVAFLYKIACPGHRSQHFYRLSCYIIAAETVFRMLFFFFLSFLGDSSMLEDYTNIRVMLISPILDRRI